MTKINLTSKALGKVRKKAFEEAYIPTQIKNSCIIFIDALGEIIVRENKNGLVN